MADQLTPEQVARLDAIEAQLLEVEAKLLAMRATLPELHRRIEAAVARRAARERREADDA